MSSPAILGTSVARCRSFEPAIPASGAGSALADIAQGGYALVASVDAWIKIGITGDSVAHSWRFLRVVGALSGAVTAAGDLTSAAYYALALRAVTR